MTNKKKKPLKNNAKQIDPNKCLPPELTVEWFDDIFYRIGLSVDSNREQPKRSKFFNPYLKFLFISMYFLKEFIVGLIGKENDLLLKIMGSFGNLLGIRYFSTTFILVLSLYALITHFNFFLLHVNGMKPEGSGVLQMVSGSIPPISLGLTNEKKIKRLVEFTKLSINVLEFSNWVFPIWALVTMITIYSVKCSLIETLLFGIPNAVLLKIWTLYVFSHVIIYFNVVSYNLNNNLIDSRHFEFYCTL